MPRRDTEPCLRMMVILSQAGELDGIPSTESLHMLKEQPPEMGGGTPARPTTTCHARSPNTNPPPPAREYRNITLPAHLSIQEATNQLSRLLEPHATLQAASLSLSLASLIETENLLPGFSSPITAILCIEISALSLDLEPLLSIETQDELGIHQDAVRIAYNQLWIQRGRLEGTIWCNGGDPIGLPSPRRADGSLDRVAFARGVGFTVSTFQSRERDVWTPPGRAARRFGLNADDLDS